MNKVEYLAALKEALKDTDQSIMEEIISDYEEHFSAGLENGKTEEEICEDLGKIEDLVEEIKEVYETSADKKKQKEEENENKQNTNEKSRSQKSYYHQESWGFNFDGIDGDKIGKAINNVMGTAGEAINTALNTAGEAIDYFANTYFKNQSNEDGQSCNQTQDGEAFHATKDESFDVSEETKGCINLVIDALCADVIVKPSMDNKINVNYVNNGNERQQQMYEFYSYQEGDTVFAGLKKVGKSVFFFNFNLNTIRITIELPEKMNSIQIKTASGNIQVEDTNGTRITLDNASGDIDIKRVISNDIQIKTATGDVDLRDVNSKQLAAKTMSGDANASNITADNFLFKSTSGDVDVKNTKVTIFDTSSMSGDINLTNINADECKVRSTSGDVDVNCLTTKHSDISSTSGDVDLTNVSGEGIRATSTSGEVTIDITAKQCHVSSKSGDVDIKCNGDVNLESSSTSGNVKVHLRNDGNGYRVNSRTTSGEFYINYGEDRRRNLKTGTYTYGNEGSQLELSSVSGDIHLNA